MRALIQRVSKASVTIGGTLHAAIGRGVLVFIGIEALDTEEDISWLVHKIAGLRIFDDLNGVMNLSVKEIRGEALVVSQFTLHARMKKGFRPSYIDAAAPAVSIPLYEQFVRSLDQELETPVQTGEFGAMMEVSLVNDGPVTLWIDTKNKQ
jgi:D-tyrosyl-tRNA(Tyr) deacylase